MTAFRRTFFPGVLLLCAVPAFAFLPPEDTEGPATLSISGPAEVKTPGEALPLTVTVKNSGTGEIKGDIRLSVIDGWKVENDAPQPVNVAPHSAQSVPFRVIPAKDSYAALYPVHAWGDLHAGSSPLTLHAILIASVSGTAGVAPHSMPGPAITTGPPQEPEAEAKRLARRQKALELARAALHGDSSAWSWKLESDAGTTGAAIVPGPAGIADAFIAFAGNRHELVLDGFTMQVDNQTIAAADRVDSAFDAGCGTITSRIACDGAPLALQARMWAEKGALRIAFSMPGTQRNERGEPRFTALSVGPASELAHRVYAGFGNVLQDPERFDLPPGGFSLSTRHVGMDFTNGLSLVEATDIYPDGFHVDPEKKLYALAAHHDAVFTLVPSTHGAFAAARVYRRITGFQPGGGFATLAGRMCLDQWDGNYVLTAFGLESAANYGLTDAVFVKHVWQHWGYDYRLPDIFPPKGHDFDLMARTCKRHGILFAPHDNYIDFYPDADGYSYDHIAFGGDGSPEKAWLNEGRGAQSWRWSPNAFQPWLERNLKLIKAGFAPTAYFVDVFSAVPPMDFYDRAGRFYPKMVTTQRWGAAFDRIREILGGNAPTISEAGDDSLTGHLDAGEADHSGWLPDAPGTSFFRWTMKAADGERIPWHDMASHGSFVLLGGGLGWRYAGGQDEVLHGFGSDDYLSLTVLGGRNPMCDGPFSRRTVMTYWLLHDVCAGLARSEMLSDEFAGDDIHRQIVCFSNDGEVRVNRGKTDWTTGGATLPQYGFIARSGENEAGITRRDGIISAYAKSPGVLFVDARPDVPRDDPEVTARVADVEDLGNRQFWIRIDWRTSRPVSPDVRSYLHFVNEKQEGAPGEGIAFQGQLNLTPQDLGQAGSYTTTAKVTLPPGIAGPAEFAIRFGLFRAGGNGARLSMAGPVDDKHRAKGGHVVLKDSAISWKPEPPDPVVTERVQRLNTAGAMVDFGVVATNGAFRLIHGTGDWQLIPLPGSPAFQVELHLDKLGAGKHKVLAIIPMGPHGSGDLRVDALVDNTPVKFRQDGQTVRFECSNIDAFAYRIPLTN